MASQLDLARSILKQEHQTLDIQKEVGLDDYVRNLIDSNLYTTLNIQFDGFKVKVIFISDNDTKVVSFPSYTDDAYYDFCSHLFELKKDEKYNFSNSKIIDGIRTRIFAIMPPLTKFPDITISTTKIPPTMLNKQTIPDEIFNKIIHSNFMIIGGSGSGKTYLFNYLLNKFINPNERIALIEEFGELIPPNELTTQIIVPPPKPGQDSLLQFITQQSNLMRLNSIYLGEIKGGEAWPMIINMASGTKGGFTMHGEDEKQALSRLRALCKMGCDSISEDIIDEFISKSLNYIIVMDHHNIKNIFKLTGTHIKNNFTLQEINS